MSLDGFLTFLGLLAASLAIMSPVARLQMLMASVRLAAISIVLFGCILYLEFFDFVGQHCPADLEHICPVVDKSGPVTPQQVAFLVVVTWLIILVHAWLRPRANLRSLPTLRRLVHRLVETRSYSDLIDLLERHLDFIDACASGNLPFQLRRARLVGEHHSMGIVISGGILPFLIEEEEEPAPPTLLEALLIRVTALPARLKGSFGSRLPERAWARRAATSVLEILVRNPRVVEFIAEHRPRFGARLLVLKSQTVGDFADDFLDWQIVHRQSALYNEVRRLDGPIGVAYSLPEESAVLTALFTDANVAHRLAPYRPVGERMIALLNPVNGAEYPAQLIKAHDSHFDEHGRWNDPVYVGLRFFDVMVRSAARDGIEWHMWLYYMPHFVKSLEAIYDDSSGDHDREYPTPAAQLLNEMVEMLSGWIAIANTVPEGSPHRRPTNDRVDNENGNIPKSAAIALGLCLKTVIMSDRVSRVVKGALLRCALSTLKDLSRDAGGNGALRRATLGSIIAGGGLGNAQYRECLKELVEDTDPFWLAGIDDFTDALAATGTP